MRLEDCEENLAMNMHEIFKIDPLFFVKLLSLSWKAAIRTTRIELELPTDVNMILFMKQVLEEE